MRKNFGNYVISALFVINRCGIRNKPRLNLISPKPPPPLSVRQYLLFSFFLYLSFLLSYFFDWGGGGLTAWEARPFRPPDLLLTPFLFFFLFFLSLFLLFPFPFFSFLLFFFFFFFLRGGGGPRPARPPPWIRAWVYIHKNTKGGGGWTPNPPPPPPAYAPGYYIVLLTVAIFFVLDLNHFLYVNGKMLSVKI